MSSRTTNRPVVFRWTSLFWQPLAVVLAVFLGGVGCGDDAPAHTDAAGGSDAAVDANSSSDGQSVDASPPSPTTFRLTYAPTMPGPPTEIYVQIACSQMWVRVIAPNGDTIPIDSDCGLCQCDSCDTCAVCDCALLIESIPSGTSRDHAWNGVTHPTRNQDGCGVCSYEDTLAPGSYTARFCYSFSSDGASECADETFEYPSATVVEHIVTTSAP